MLPLILTSDDYRQLKPKLKKILEIVADLAGNDVKKDALETDIEDY
jgi:hypothetical protein